MKEDKTAPEVALYLTFLAYKSRGLAAVRTALSALRYYAKLQGAEGSYMKDPLIETVVKGLERDFSKPIQQKEGFSPEEMRRIIKYFLREKICPKLIDLRMACLCSSSTFRLEDSRKLPVSSCQTSKHWKQAT